MTSERFRLEMSIDKRQMRRRRGENQSSLEMVIIEENDHEDKNHPSPFYKIFRIDRISQFFVVLSAIVFAADGAQLAMSLPNDESTSSHDTTQEYIVNVDGSVIDILENSTQPISRAPYKDFPLDIAFLKEREGDSRWITSPLPPMPTIETDDDSESYYASTIPDNFHYFYSEAPDLNKNAINIEDFFDDDEDDGHVYTDEDFTDDRLVGAPQYLLEYAAGDDDVLFSPKEQEDGTLTAQCRKPSWYNDYYPTCNNSHEAPIWNKDEYDAYYIASGAYRDAFAIYDREVVLKIVLYERDYDIDLLDMIRADALVMNLLSTSPRIVNMYSYCGASVHVEAVNGPSIEDVVFNQKGEDMDESLPILTPTEKLDMAIAMAEGIADLHGYKDGLIVHFDIQMGQYLLDEYLGVRMSDFNRADFLLWDEEAKEYCPALLGKANGSLRSPEEYGENFSDEKSDVYSFGNIIFTLLTQEYPYERYGYDAAGAMSVRAMTPYVSDSIRGRSFAEAALAEVMDKCYEYMPDRRIDIFTAISLLKEAASLNEQFESIEVSKLRYPVELIFSDDYYSNWSAENRSFGVSGDEEGEEEEPPQNFAHWFWRYFTSGESDDENDEQSDDKVIYKNEEGGNNKDDFQSDRGPHFGPGGSSDENDEQSDDEVVNNNEDDFQSDRGTHFTSGGSSDENDEQSDDEVVNNNEDDFQSDRGTHFTSGGSSDENDEQSDDEVDSKNEDSNNEDEFQSDRGDIFFEEYYYG